MVTRKTAIMVLLVPSAVFTLLAAGGSGGPGRERGWWARPQPAEPTSATKAKVPPIPAALAAKARLDSSSVKKWYVQWNEQTGMITGISGESKQYSGSPREVADQFLREHRALFTGLPQERDPGDVAYLYDTAWYDRDPTRPADIIKFNETYKGIPVYQGGATVHVGPTGQVLGVGANSYSIDALDVTPARSISAALEALKVATLPDSVIQSGEIDLLIKPDPLGAHLAYRMSVMVRSSGKRVFSGDVFVDAHSGEVLGKRSWIRHDGKSHTLDSSADSVHHSGLPEADKQRRHRAKADIPIRRGSEDEWQTRNTGGGGQYPIHT
ncbi:MAG: PepSY domain-containing protein [candidate division Zixibacteria bacterium]|nr:PepSY domain-containing protein [candidate division Zixibacteria bacterium]